MQIKNTHQKHIEINANTHGQNKPKNKNKINPKQRNHIEEIF